MLLNTACSFLFIKIKWDGSGGCRIKRKVLKTIASQTKSEKIRLRPDFFHKKTSQTSKNLTHLVKYKYATTRYFTG